MSDIVFTPSQWQPIQKPTPGEYPAYAEMYLKWLPPGDQLLVHLHQGLEKAIRLIDEIPEHRFLYRYEVGKWTTKEVVVHIIDDERIYAYRAMCFARNEQTALPGFEQDDYAAHSGANERSIDSIRDEYIAVRQATIALFNSFSTDALLRKGVANNHTASVRALGYHIAGHELHHLDILRRKYLL